MKNFVIIAILILFFTPKTIAATSSYKTFTPVSPYYNYNNGYFPPHPHPNIINHNNKYWNRRNYYNSYNNPYYYYPQRRTLFNSIGDFFSSGKMTGYTNSNFDNDIPYDYQEGFQDSNGNYYKHNYGTQNGATIKILD